MGFLVIYFIVCVSKIAVNVVSGKIEDGNESLWRLAPCQNNSISIQHVHARDEIHEVVSHSGFGYAYNIRDNFYVCDSLLTIPLLFTAQSLAVTNQHVIVAISDHLSDEDTNIRKIEINNFIGGFLYFIESLSAVESSCPDWVNSTINFYGNNGNQPVCSEISIDEKEIYTRHIVDFFTNNQDSYYEAKSALEYFRHDLSRFKSTFELTAHSEKLEKWLSWTSYEQDGQFQEVSLLHKHSNDLVARDDRNRLFHLTTLSKTEVLSNGKVIRAMSMSSAQHIDKKFIVTIVDKRIRIVADLLTSLTHIFQTDFVVNFTKIFALSNELIAALDQNNQMFYSTTLVKEILQSVMKIGLDGEVIEQEKLTSIRYTESVDATCEVYPTGLSYDDNFISFGNEYDYTFYTSNKPALYHEKPVDWCVDPPVMSQMQAELLYRKLYNEVLLRKPFNYFTERNSEVLFWEGTRRHLFEDTGFSWMKAFNDCENRGMVLCSKEDICENGLPPSVMPSSTHASNMVPIRNIVYEWMDLKYDVCKTHIELWGDLPTWGRDLTLKSFINGYYCCERPPVYKSYPEPTQSIVLVHKVAFSWMDASNDCEDNGKYLCSKEEICVNGTVPNELPVVYNVNGRKWVPIRNIVYEWMDINAVPCQTYKEYFNTLPTWGRDRTLRINLNGYYCCSRRNTKESKYFPQAQTQSSSVSGKTIVENKDALCSVIAFNTNTTTFGRRNTDCNSKAFHICVKEKSDYGSRMPYLLDERKINSQFGKEFVSTAPLEDYIPVAYDYPLFYKTYDYAVNFCLQEGKVLCSRDELCKLGQPPYDRTAVEDKYVPVSDSYNEWMQVGEKQKDIPCWLHNSYYNPPTWGTQGLNAIKQSFYCCTNTKSNQYPNAPTQYLAAPTAIENEDFVFVPNENWFTWQESFDACEDLGMLLCRAEDICKNGKPPIRSFAEPDVWMPVRNTFNEWIQVVDASRLCGLHYDLHGIYPSWGVNGDLEYEKQGFYCCAKPNKAKHKDGAFKSYDVDSCDVLQTNREPCYFNLTTTKEQCIKFGCCFDVASKDITTKCYKKGFTGDMIHTESSFLPLQDSAAAKLERCQRDLPDDFSCKTFFNSCSQNGHCVTDADDKLSFTCHCNDGFIGNGKICTKIYPSYIDAPSFSKSPFLNFWEAEQMCNGHGGHLASIKSQDEYEFTSSTDAAWIGAYFSPYIPQNNFYWNDGMPCCDGFLTSTEELELALNLPGGCALLNQVKKWDSCAKQKSYMCEVKTQPEYLNIEIYSLSDGSWLESVISIADFQFSTYSNFETESEGCLVLFILNQFGERTYKSNACSADPDKASTIETFFAEEVPRATYFGIVLSGRNIVHSDKIISKMQAMGVEDAWPEGIHQTSSFIEKISSCDDINSLLSKNEEGKLVCVEYSAENFQQSMLNISFSYGVKNESVSIITINLFNGAEQLLSCSVETDIVDKRGINVAFTDESDFIKKATCIKQPCIAQIICVKHTEQTDTPGSATLVCRRFASGKVICPLQKQVSKMDDILIEQIEFQHVRDQPVFLSMDDVMNLGGRTAGERGKMNFTFLEWEWHNDKYASTNVLSVKGRALTFHGAKVTPWGTYPCWENPGTDICPHGFTSLFWLNVVQNPSTNHLWIFDSGQTSDVVTGRIGVFVDPDENYLNVFVIMNDDVWMVKSKITSKLWTLVRFSFSQAQGLKLALNEETFVASESMSWNPAMEYFDNNVVKFTFGSSSYDGKFSLDEFFFFPQDLPDEVAISFMDEFLPFRYELFEDEEHKIASISTSEDELLFLLLDSYDADSMEPILYQLTKLEKKFNFTNGITIYVTIKVNNQMKDDLEGRSLLTIVTDDFTGSLDTNLEGHRLNLKVTFEETEVFLHLNEMYFTENYHEDSSRLAVAYTDNIPVIIQLQSLTKWIMCVNAPTNCINFKTGHSSVPMKNMFDSKNIIYSMQSETGIVKSVKCIMDDLDLTMGFEELRSFSLVGYWPLLSDLNDSHGEQKFLITGTQLEFTPHSGVAINPNITSDPGRACIRLPIESCLKNIATCKSGFTIQFELKPFNCKEEYGYSDCMYLSIGEIYFNSPYGLIFHQSSKDQQFKVIVSMSPNRWTAKFSLPLDAVSKIRIAWRKEHGLQIFINDVRYFQVNATTVSLNEHSGTSSQLFIGCSSKKTHHSRMEISHLFIWETVVEGYLGYEMAHSCKSSEKQIGEMCYWYDAGNNCSQGGGILANPYSYHIAREIREMFSSSASALMNIGLQKGDHGNYWSSGLTTEQLGFDLEEIDTPSATTFGIFILPYLRLPVWATTSYIFTEAICEKPTNIDHRYLGCIAKDSLSQMNKSPIDLIHLPYEELSENNNIGTRYLPTVCSQACWNKHSSNVIAIVNKQCYCFPDDCDKETTMPLPRLPTSECVTDSTTDPRYHCAVTQLQSVVTCGGKTGLESPESVLSLYGSTKSMISDVFIISSYHFDFVRTNADPIYFSAAITLEVFEIFHIEIKNLHCKEVGGTDTSVFCPNMRITINCDFGDGNIFLMTTYKQEIPNIFHYYSSNTPRKVICTIQNEENAQKSVVRISSEISFFNPASKIILSHIVVVPVAVNEEVKITVEAVSGNHMTCTAYFGDTSVESYKVSEVPVPVIQHTYSTAQKYVFKIKCSNRLHVMEIQEYIYVDEAINILDVPKSVKLNYGAPLTFDWRLHGGSEVICYGLFGNTSIPYHNAAANQDFYFYLDKDTLRGNSFVSSNLYNLQGQIPDDEIPFNYIMSTTCYNSVTKPITALTYISLCEDIVKLNVDLKSLTYFFQPNEIKFLEVSVDGGTNIILQWDFDDTEDKNIVEYCVKGCHIRQNKVQYSKVGRYNIKITASNLCNIFSHTIAVSVENPINTINILTENVPRLSTPIEVVISHDTPVIMDIDLNFGDGKIIKDNIFLTENNLKHSIFHSYADFGVFQLYLFARNNISNANDSTSVKVGSDVKGLTASIISVKNVRPQKDIVRFEVKLIEGSAVSYQFFFGDEHLIPDSKPYEFVSNLTRIDSLDADYNTLIHVYSLVGNFTCKVVATNLFNQLEYTLPSPVVSQNPLDGNYILIPKPVGLVSFPDGKVVFDATLSHGIPYFANNVHAKWVISGENTEQLLDEKYGEVETDLFPYNITVTSIHIGDVIVKADLSNVVSQTTLNYYFTVIELIEEISVSVLSFAPACKIIQDKYSLNNVSVNCPVSDEILFIVTTEKGSNVTYKIEFGDSETESKPTTKLLASQDKVKFSHAYSDAGTYIVNLTAHNSLMSTFQTLTNIQIHDKVSGLKLLVRYIDDPEFNVLISNYSSVSYKSIFAGVKFGESTYFPAQKPILFTTSIKQGTSVTCSVNLPQAAIEVGNNYVSFKSIEGWSITDDKNTFHNDVFTARVLDSYETSSRILVEYNKSGKQKVDVNCFNEVSQETIVYEFIVEEEVESAVMLPLQLAPLANWTTNFSMEVEHVGTDPCILITWGDGSQPIAFGMSSMCLAHANILENYYHSVGFAENMTIFAHDTFIQLSWGFSNDSGILEIGDTNVTQYHTSTRLLITTNHTYFAEGVYKMKVMLFNRVSTTEVIFDVPVTLVLCEYPTVKIEKSTKNSYHTPRHHLKSLSTQLYSYIFARCLLTNKRSISWGVYKVLHEEVIYNETSTSMHTSLDQYVKQTYHINKHVFVPVGGLHFTNKSQSVVIPRFVFDYGVHLFCINVQMYNVPGVNSSDCIFVRIGETPLVAGILYGTARKVGYRQPFDMDAKTVSYDPDVNSKNVENDTDLIFTWSCLLTENEFVGGYEGNYVFTAANSIATRSVQICQSTNNVNISCSETVEQLDFNNTQTTLSLFIRNECQDSNMCIVYIDEWLSENQGYLTSNETKCENVEYKCKPSDDLLCQMDFEFNVGDKVTHDNVSEQIYEYHMFSNPCVSNGYYPKIFNIRETCEDNYIMAMNSTSCGIFAVNSTTLSAETSYRAYVRVKDHTGKRSSQSYQSINIVQGLPPPIKIVCKSNCLPQRNSYISYKVEATCDMCNALSMSYVWSLYTVFNDTYTPVDDFENNMTSTGVYQQSLVIHPQALDRGTKYMLKLVASIPNYQSGLTAEEFSTNIPPFGGDCSIQPSTGYATLDKFTIHCFNWKDKMFEFSPTMDADSIQLEYHVLIQTSPSKNRTRIAHGSVPTLSELQLLPGVADNDYLVYIFVNVIDEFKGVTEVQLNATIFEQESYSEEDFLNVTTSFENSSGMQDTLQKVEMLSAMLNKKPDNISTTVSPMTTAPSNHQRLLSEEQKAESERQQEKNKIFRSDLRKKAIDAVSSVAGLDSIEGIEQTGTTILGLTQETDEIDKDSQSQSVNLLSDMANSLSNLGEDVSPDAIQLASDSMIGIVGNVIKAAKQNVQKSSGFQQGEESFSVDNICNVLPNDPEYLYLSPEEQVERLKEICNEKNATFQEDVQQIEEVSKQALASVSSLANSIMKNTLPGEPPIQMVSGNIKVELQKERLSSINSGNSAHGFVLPNITIDGTNADDIVQIEVAVSDSNPFVWDSSADTVRSNVMNATVNLANGININSSKSPFRMELLPSSDFVPVSPKTFEFSPMRNNMSYHEITISSDIDEIFLSIQPVYEQKPSLIRIYFIEAYNKGIFPTMENYTVFYELPANSSDANFPYRLQLNSTVLGNITRYVFGFHEIDIHGEMVELTSMSFKNYSVGTFITSCKYWDEIYNQWKTDGCEVDGSSSQEKVVCLCNHLTAFGANFFVAPNPIDFSVIAKNIQNLANNLSVLITLALMVVLYFVGVIYFRRQDKYDEEKWSVLPLRDNQLSSNFYYLMTVKTGSLKDAGTKSKIYFVIGGKSGDTRVRNLSTTKDMILENGVAKKFLLSLPEPILGMEYIRIWHDNSGKGKWASWYLDSITIKDLQSNKVNLFFCNNWLSVNHADGKIDRIITVADDNDITNFKNLFKASKDKSFSDEHLWYSLFSRPTKSYFTRVQRFSCAISILLCTMLSSAMYFGRSEDNPNQQGQFELGPVKITVQQIMVSIQSSLTVVPVNILLVQIFRKVSPPQEAKQDNDDDESEDKETKKRFMLPHWCIYIAWFIIALIFIGCCGVIFLYSIMWGAEKSIDWLTSVFFSFFQSVCIIQPAKVVLTAILFSLFIQKCAKRSADDVAVGVLGDEEDVMENHIQVTDINEDWLLRFPDEDLDDISKQGMLPPSNKQLRNAKREQIKHRRMIAAVHKIIAYLFYLCLLLAAANTAKDANAFHFHKSLSDIFVKNGKPNFLQIKTTEDVWEWLGNACIDGLYAGSWYNGKRIYWSETQYISNRESFKMGPPRIRQLRSSNKTCATANLVEDIRKDCIEQYNLWSGEEGNFQPMWMSYDKNFTINYEENNPWIYKTTSMLKGAPFEGRIRYYGGGGYVIVLENTASKSRNSLQKLQKENWIDRHTQGIFIEFTVYNSNVNLFGVCMLLLERHENGAFHPQHYIKPIRLYDYIDGKGYILTAIYITFLLVFIYRTYKVIQKIRKMKKKYFKEFWNVLDLLEVVLSFGLFVMFILKKIHTEIVLKEMKNHSEQGSYVNFHFLSTWSDIFRYLLALVLFLATARFIEILKFNRRIRLLSRTLSYAAVPLLCFTCMLGIYFIAFLFLAYIWFNQKLYAFSEAVLSSEEMISMMLGRFDFSGLQAADPLLGPIFFICFQSLCSIVLIGMFVVILDETIRQVQDETKNEQNEFEVLDYMSKKAAEAFYSKIPSRWLKKTDEDKIIYEKEEDFHVPKYIAYPEEVLEIRINAIARRVDELEKKWYQKQTVEDLEMGLYD